MFSHLRSSSLRRPGRRVGVLILALAVTGCSQAREAPGAAAPLPEPVRQQGEIGEQAELMDLRLDMLSVEAFDRTVDGFPRLRAIVRSENPTERMRRNPDVELWCDEAETGGEWFLGSTWEANALLPPREVSEGEIYLGFPPKPGAERYPVAECSNARIVVTATETTDRSQEVLTYQIEPATIEAAIDAPEGRARPLPPRGE